MEDTSMENDSSGSHLPLSHDESRVLALYDRLQELRLEIAVINAQSQYAGNKMLPPACYSCFLLTGHLDDNGAIDDDEDENAGAAKAALLEARARYMLRNEVAESVMTINPILKAVHAGRDASMVERQVVPGLW